MGLPEINWPFRGATGSASRVPLTKRLHAWWEGYEIIPPEGSGSEEPLEELDNFSDRFPAPTPGEVWSEERRELVQLIWGNGFSMPGGYDYSCDLVSAFSLTSAVSMLEFGSGMGGGARAIVDKFGTYVTALEADPELARAGMFLSKTHSIEDKAGVESFALDSLELKEGYYEGVLVRAALLGCEDKEELITQAVRALKPEGQIVITDVFVEKDSDREQSECRKWMETEPGNVYPWLTTDVQKCLNKLNVLIRITADESNEYQSRVLSGWDGFINNISPGRLRRNLTIPLVQEAEIWARRMAAMDAGYLRFYRYVGVKNH